MMAVFFVVCNIALPQLFHLIPQGGIIFYQNKWSVIAGLQYINGLYIAVGDAEQKENFCLLNATFYHKIRYTMMTYFELMHLLYKGIKRINDESKRIGIACGAKP